MRAVDTNILIYAHDPRDPTKQKIALTLIKSLTDGVLLWQVACEYIAASRKLGKLGYSQTQAWQDVRQLRQVWTTLLPSWQTFDEAERLLNKYSLSFWDATIIAACLKGGVKRLYSEDFSGYGRVNGLEIINPF